MSVSRPLRILAVAALGLAGLIGLVVHEGLERAAGTDVVLRMEAVDPRAVLSGHFVRISLREPIPTGNTCPPGAPSVGLNEMFNGFPNTPGTPKLWIALAPRGDHVSVVGAARDRRAALRYAPMVVKGSVRCVAGLPQPGPALGVTPIIDLDLGVDRYHVAQAQAQRIDALLNARRVGQDSPVSAIVSIGRDGQARLVGLMVQGRREALSFF